MARRSHGKLYKRTIDGREVFGEDARRVSGTWYLLYYANGKRFRQALKKESGDPITREEDAKRRQEEILRPLQAAAIADKRRAVVHALEDAEESARGSPH